MSIAINNYNNQIYTNVSGISRQEGINAESTLRREDKLTWALTILSIIGVILNIKRHKACFIIWAFTNFAWMVVDWWHGLYSQAVLFAIYFCLAIWGLKEWKHKG